MFRTVTTTMLALGALTAAGCSTDRPLLGEDRDQLTVAQCSFFAEGDKVQICHRTGSARNPYNVIRTNIASCGGHSGHVGDYITSTNPADPEYDPTCSGQGCFPEGAPFDNTVECCAGLSPQGGFCRDINECATNNGGCGAGFSCANAPVSGDAPICTPPAAVCGDGIGAGAEQCDDGNTHAGDGCSATCAVEGGFVCNGFPSACATICGDGFRAGSEQCDDGNSVNGDGCSNSCTLPCAATPCENGGTCTNEVDGYACTCAGFYTGTNCETPPACDANPCQNGGQCENTTTGSGYSCTCVGLYTGTNCETFQCPSASAPSHQWTFNDGTAHDSAGSADGGLFGGASIVNGELVLNNAATVPNQHVNGQYMKAALPDAVSTKTLVVWARLANLTQQGGSALTIEDRIVDNTGSNHFDAVDYAEQVAGQWMAGSNNFDRTKVGSNGGAPETSTDAVMLAIVYGADNSITIYRNGALYMNPPSYVKGALLSYLGGASDAVIGLRHSQCNNNCWLSGSIDEARIYPTALTACQIEALQPVPQPAPSCPAGSTLSDGRCYKFVAALTSQPAALAACRLLPGGDLASAHSTEENRFLGTIVDPNGNGNGVGGLTAWIGGISPQGFNCAGGGANGIFNWTDGSAWNYNAWRTVTNEPDGCPGVPVCTQLFPDNAFFHNNICGNGQTGNGQTGCSGWNDVPCSFEMGYVCQFAPN